MVTLPIGLLSYRNTTLSLPLPRVRKPCPLKSSSLIFPWEQLILLMIISLMNTFCYFDHRTLSTTTFWFIFSPKGSSPILNGMINDVYIVRILGITSLVMSFTNKDSTPFYIISSLTNRSYESKMINMIDLEHKLHHEVEKAQIILNFFSTPIYMLTLDFPLPHTDHTYKFF
jgi:hypothetical protein